MKSIVPLLLALAVGGCAHIDLPAPLANLTRPHVDQAQVERWIAEEQYGLALDSLRRADPRREDYATLAALREHLNGLVADYEREVLAEADRLSAAGDWAATLDLLDRALLRLPDSTVLRDGLAALHERQQRAAEAAEIELLATRAAALRHELAHYSAIARIRPRDADAAARLRQVRDEAETTAAALNRHGMAAQERGAMAAARRLLRLGTALHATPEAEAALARVDTWYAEQARRRQAANAERRRQAAQQRAAAEQRQARQAERMQELLASYRGALAEHRPLRARAVLDVIARETPDALDLAAEHSRVDALAEAEAQQLFEQAVLLYGREEFAQALALWQRVLQLRPGHSQAQEHAARAQRVLNKVEELRAKQASGA